MAAYALGHDGPGARPRVFGDGAYTATKTLGRGTFGTVYKCVRTRDQHVCVVKCVPLTGLGEDDRRATLNECVVMSRIEHPNIIRYYESFVEPDTGDLCVVMEYAPGGDLSSLLARHSRPFAEPDLWNTLIQLSQGLKEMHSKRILHRDLKPHNILLDRTGNVKIGDLGLGRVLSWSTMARTSVGTPLYMSPEVTEERPYDEKSDIWSMGCLLYELATLSPPFRATNQIALARKIVFDAPPPLPAHLGDEFRFLVMKMLEKDSALRPTVEQVLNYSGVRIRIAVAEYKNREMKLKQRFSEKERAYLHRIASLEQQQHEQTTGSAMSGRSTTSASSSTSASAGTAGAGPSSSTGKTATAGSSPSRSVAEDRAPSQHEQLQQRVGTLEAENAELRRELGSRVAQCAAFEAEMAEVRAVRAYVERRSEELNMLEAKLQVGQAQLARQRASRTSTRSQGTQTPALEEVAAAPTLPGYMGTSDGRARGAAAGSTDGSRVAPRDSHAFHSASPMSYAAHGDAEAGAGAGGGPWPGGYAAPVHSAGSFPRYEPGGGPGRSGAYAASAPGRVADTDCAGPDTGSGSGGAAEYDSGSESRMLLRSPDDLVYAVQHTPPHSRSGGSGHTGDGGTDNSVVSGQEQGRCAGGASRPSAASRRAQPSTRGTRHVARMLLGPGPHGSSARACAADATRGDGAPLPAAAALVGAGAMDRAATGSSSSSGDSPPTGPGGGPLLGSTAASPALHFPGHDSPALAAAPATAGGQAPAGSAAREDAGSISATPAGRARGHVGSAARAGAGASRAEPLSAGSPPWPTPAADSRPAHAVRGSALRGVASTPVDYSRSALGPPRRVLVRTAPAEPAGQRPHPPSAAAAAPALARGRRAPVSRE